MGSGIWVVSVFTVSYSKYPDGRKLKAVV